MIDTLFIRIAFLVYQSQGLSFYLMEKVTFVILTVV